LLFESLPSDYLADFFLCLPHGEEKTKKKRKTEKKKEEEKVPPPQGLHEKRKSEKRFLFRCGKAAKKSEQNKGD
jgi:hypothetical protein